MDTVDNIKAHIRNIPGFPQPGVQFKDITPLLKDPELCREAAQLMLAPFNNRQIDAVACVESRGFIVGMLISQLKGVPFIPIRKKGKLPFTTFSEVYALEYGTEEIEIHTDAILPGARVLLHDDVLATGGTARAACNLVKKAGGQIVGAAFIIELSYLNGLEKLKQVCPHIVSLVTY